MGKILIVEADTDDRLHLAHLSGVYGGKAILTFLQAASAYSSNASESPDVVEWFAALDTYVEGRLLGLMPAVWASLVSWSEATSATNDVNSVKWVDAAELLQVAKDIVSALLILRPQPAWWYQPEDTIIDFYSLAETLSLLVARNATRVRLIFR